MSRYPSIRLRIDKFVTPTQLQEKLLEIIDDDEVRRGVNQIIGERANEYVPMKSGALRDSMHVGPKTISWGTGLDYGGYQYRGEVYGPNIPIVSQGAIVGWFSIPGMQKQPMGRKFGEPVEISSSGIWGTWPFGYTTPGTTYHWIDEMMANDRRGLMNQITAYLKREAKRRNV